jgi:hypothetical protein
MPKIESFAFPAGILTPEEEKPFEISNRRNVKSVGRIFNKIFISFLVRCLKKKLCYEVVWGGAKCTACLARPGGTPLSESNNI